MIERYNDLLQKINRLIEYNMYMNMIFIRQLDRQAKDKQLDKERHTKYMYCRDV